MSIIGIDPSLTSTGVSDGTRHILLTTKPSDTMSPLQDTVRRVNMQIRELKEWLPSASRVHMFYVEDVLKTMVMRGSTDADGNVKATVGAGHLFEMGVWFTIFHQTFPNYRLVTPSQLKSFVTGKGNFSKAKMPLAVFKRWNIEFDADPGLDKLHAYCLYRLGMEVENGAYELTESKRRGQGHDAKAATKRRARS